MTTSGLGFSSVIGVATWGFYRTETISLAPRDSILARLEGQAWGRFLGRWWWEGVKGLGTGLAGLRQFLGASKVLICS